MYSITALFCTAYRVNRFTDLLAFLVGYGPPSSPDRGQDSLPTAALSNYTLSHPYSVVTCKTKITSFHAKCTSLAKFTNKNHKDRFVTRKLFGRIGRTDSAQGSTAAH